MIKQFEFSNSFIKLNIDKKLICISFLSQNLETTISTEETRIETCLF